MQCGLAVCGRGIGNQSGREASYSGAEDGGTHTMARFVAILARQRSGTSYVRSLLSSSGRFQEFGGEVVNSKACDANYLTFRARRLRTEPELSFPTPENVERLFAEYLEFLSTKISSDKIGILDLKYNALHHFNSVWQAPFGPPQLLSLLRRASIPIIHIVRKNVFAALCSERCAHANNCWVVFAQQPSALKKIFIDPGQGLMRDLEDRERELTFFRSLLASRSAVIELVYEEIAHSPACFVEQAGPALERLLQIKLPQQLSVNCCKIISDPLEVVENRAEVEEALRNSRHAHYLDEARSPCSL